MKRTRFTEEQIVGILKQSEAGMKTVEVCRQNGISEATFYNWKAKYGGMAASDVQKLKRLEKKRQAQAGRGRSDARQCGAERPTLKKLLEPASKRAAVAVVRDQHGMSERRACRLTGLARSTQRRKLEGKADDDDKHRLQELSRERQRFGYRRLTASLRREGLGINHKRVYRMYRELGLTMRKRKRKRKGSGQRLAAAATTRLQRKNQRWAMDFVSDTLAHGRTFCLLTIIDEYTRECLAMETDTSLPGLRVVRVLQHLALTRGMPEEIHIDHGPQFICRSVRSWCEEHRVLLRYIEPGRPMQNGHIEFFNGRLRDECLNANWFLNLAHARTQSKLGEQITTKHALTARLLTRRPTNSLRSSRSDYRNQL